MIRPLQRLLLCCILLLSGVTAHAGSISFSGGAVTNCSLSGKSYSCSSMPQIDWNDSITIADQYAVTINGSYSHSYNKSLTMSGSASLTTNGNLDFSNTFADNMHVSGGTLTANGGTFAMNSGSLTANVIASAVTMNTGATLTGTVTSSGIVTGGSSVTVTGNVSGTTVTFGSSSRINGSVSGSSINVDSSTVVTGSLTSSGPLTAGSSANIGGSVAGTTITLGSSVRVGGGVTASSTVTVGSDATISGAVSGSNITFDSRVTVGGSVAASADLRIASSATMNSGIRGNAIFLSSSVTVTGAVASATSLEVGSSSTITGAVTGTVILFRSSVTVTGTVTGSTSVEIASSNTVTGNVSAPTVKILSSGAVVTGNIRASTSLRVESGSTVTGNVNAGSVDLLASSVYISGNIDATGSVKIESGNRVGGYVNSTSGTVSLMSSNARIDGNLTAVDIYLQYGYIIGGNLLAYSVTADSLLYNGGSLGGTSTCQVGVRYVCNGGGGGASSTFDAVEVGKAAATAIFTKLSGTAFTLDLLALTSAGAINTSATDTVTVSLVDQAGVATNTCGSATIGQSGSITFAAADNGRKTVSFTVTTAVRDVRVRISRSTGTAVTVCSSDNFAIRPAKLSVTIPNGLLNPGTVTRAAAAGVFTVSARAVSAADVAVTNYDGTPLIRPSPITALTPSGADTGALARPSGAAFPAATAATGSASASDFTYSEVGTFQFNAWSMYDDGSFASVDKNKNPSECFPGSNLGGTGTPADPNVLDSSGKYGCYFGNISAVIPSIRFIPDHFTVTSATVTLNRIPACTPAPSFAYMGEQMNLGFSLVAQNGANVTTRNYTGSSAVFTPSAAGAFNLGALDASATRTPFPVCGAPVAHPCIVPSNASGAFANGVAPVVLPFKVFRPDLGSIGVGPYPAFSLAIAPVDADGVKMVYDIDTVNVVAAANNHARLLTTALRYGRMRVNNDYRSGLNSFPVSLQAQFWNGSAFVTNTLDNCTPLNAASFGLTVASGTIGTSVNANGLMMTNGGNNGLVLSKPNPALTGKASVRLGTVAPLSDYLPGNGVLTFGISKPGPVIFIREVY